VTTLGELRDALAGTLSDALPGVNVYRTPADDVQSPALIVAGFDLEPVAFGSVAKVGVDLFAAVSRRHIDQMDQLDELVSPTGPGSAWAAISADPDLSGAVSYCQVVSVGEYRELTFGDAGYYAATIRLEVQV
jgi:hypothetical protein